MFFNEKSDQKRLRMKQKTGEKSQTKVKSDRILSLEEATF